MPVAQADDWLVFLNARGTLTSEPSQEAGLGGGVRYIGNLYGEDANQYLSPSVTLFDLAARYDLGQLASNLKGFQALLNINNVADKRYVARCTSESSCFYGNSRTILGSLAYRW